MNYFLKFKKANMEKTKLLNNNNDLVLLLENFDISQQELVYHLIEGSKYSMEDLNKASSIIIKKYGKKNVKSYKLPAVNDCEYAYSAHSNCICLHIYYRPF